MIRIAVCDDDMRELLHISNEIEEIAAAAAVETAVTAFSASGELLRLVRENPAAFDMMFLDMYIDERMGLDIAAAVRSLNTRCVIVFITGYPDKMADCFEYRASAYIMKPVDRERLQAAFLTGLSHLKHVPSFYVRAKDRELTLPFDEILYFESVLKNIRLHYVHSSEPVVFQGTLRGIDAPPEYFALCHNSFLVNFAHVTMIDKSSHDIIMRNGARIHASRQYYQKVLSNFTRFHAKKR